MSNSTTAAATFNGITLKRGDVLLKRSDWSPAHLVIALGQKIGGSSKASTVHAAISLGDDRIAESSMAGIEVNTLNGLHTWKVYRLNNQKELAELAATVALHLMDRAQRTEGFGQYSKADAMVSAFRGARGEAAIGTDIGDYVDEVLNEPAGATREFFCSNFVVQCFSVATEFYYRANPNTIRGAYVMPLDHERTSPAAMAEFLDGATVDWHKVGEITA